MKHHCPSALATALTLVDARQLPVLVVGLTTVVTQKHILRSVDHLHELDSAQLLLLRQFVRVGALSNGLICGINRGIGHTPVAELEGIALGHVPRCCEWRESLNGGITAETDGVRRTNSRST